MSPKNAILTLLLIATVFSISLAGKRAEQAIYQITPQNNNYEVGITCKNGGDPTVIGTMPDQMLLVSCGKN